MTGLLLPTDSHAGIADRVRDGDPVVGWRGDPELDVYLDTDREVCQVWGFDNRGTRYCLTEVSLENDGWRHEVLRRLRDSDYQRGDIVYREFVAAAEKRHAENDKAQAELVAEFGEHMEWAVRKDLGLPGRVF